MASPLEVFFAPGLELQGYKHTDLDVRIHALNDIMLTVHLHTDTKTELNTC